ncbi:alpha/beta hydrolase [Oceanobacillus piezotolerans]|uniref:Alpha/beta hydrolase n=1 Tax=Oceanobacillus piezotolerans TaxID=2448030 RepID=A0A498D595_9BACI|nr:alpha/beta hydrolase [Oceanobacillus piezotolerans]RLL44849.1 alpha/beta hydrolase [Oceanobacillus piezotolerans]
MGKKRWILTGVSVCILLLLFTLLVINYFYGEAVMRDTEVELYSGEEVVEVVTSEENQAIIDEAKQWFSMQELKQLEIVSKDNLLLKAHFIQQENSSDRAVILVHGFREDGMKMGEYAKFYYELGYHIILPDARGHGQSEGDYIGYGWDDRMDYLDWANLLVENYGVEEIILHGKSMGASAVLMASGEEDLPSEVKGIIADSGYTSVMEELAHQLKHLYNLPSFPLLHLTSIMANVRAGYTFQEASAINQVEKNTRALYIIHGQEDELVPTKMAHELYKAAGGEKYVWIVPGATHSQGYTVAVKEYQKRLEDFINR